MLSTYNFSVVLTLQRNPIGVRVSIEPCELFLWYQGIWVCDLFWNWNFSLPCYRHLLIENFFEAWSCYRDNCRSNFHKSNEFMQKKWFNQLSLTDPWFLVYTCMFLSPLIVSTEYKNMWYVYLIIELCLCTDEVNDNEVDCYETKCEHAMYPFFSFSLHWYLLLFIPG